MSPPRVLSTVILFLLLAACSGGDDDPGSATPPVGSKSPTASVEARAALEGTIAFVSDRDGNQEIYVMAADGSGQKRITNDPSADIDPTWSPDGTQIAYSHAGDIYVTDPDGASARPITEGPDQDVAPVWSPDGKTIAYQRLDTGGSSSIFTVTPEGDAERDLGSKGSFDSAPTFSPDGSMIAFVGAIKGNDDIYVMTSEGGSRKLLATITGGHAFALDWAPDDSRIAFGYLQETGNADVAAVTSHGKGFSFLTSRGALEPSWSPDSTFVAFQTNTGSPPDIYVVDLSRPEGQIQLTNDPGSDTSPDWAP